MRKCEFEVSASSALVEEMYKTTFFWLQNKLLDEDGSINTEGDLLLWFNYDRRPSVVV